MRRMGGPGVDPVDLGEDGWLPGPKIGALFVINLTALTAAARNQLSAAETARSNWRPPPPPPHHHHQLCPTARRSEVTGLPANRSSLPSSNCLRDSSRLIGRRCRLPLPG